ncbi:MAG: HAMP domain-containing protein [Planctomycetes bacterium]|nr:HAMP domain-containing protein [Planctomycetota bacterium]
MGYRSIKRALGETNLERKCRILFGLCLALLISLTFWRVDVIGERLVRGTINQMGHDWANISLYRLHWHALENNQDFREQVIEFEKDLLTEDYRWEILGTSADTGSWIFLPDPKVPESLQERELIANLRTEWMEQLRQAQPTATDQTRDGDIIEELQDVSDPSVLPVSDDLSDSSKKEYYYYQPVYWKDSCLKCHSTTNDALAASDLATSTHSSEPPFRVVKVIMPHEATSKAITRTRSLLIGVGILTVFLAMVALYVIVRYVIVKPLKHLRDVSEEISLGNTDLRADISTNDEFEELAHSFNRMLRHMTEAQDELRDVNVNLDAKVDELAQLNMRLYDMNRLKGDFLANMSHELRTPLNSIIGFSDVLQGITSLDDKQRRYAENIQKSGRVLLEMINDILDLAKLEAGKMEVKPTEFRLDFILSAQCDMVRSLTDEKNIDLNLIVSEDDPPVYQDQSKIQQILTNLLSNAIKFTPEGGRITVSARHLPGDKFELTVADTGIGIADEDREVIFEKFRQSSVVLDNDGLTREHSGTGLGLSIVRELCKLLGGDISFESELGQGSTFKTILPWNLADKPAFSSEISEKLDEMVKPDAAELRANAVRPVA